MNHVLWSKNSDEWTTPDDLFRSLDKEFHFTLDAAASETNAKTKRYFTAETDGLSKRWGGETVWLNPPYSQVKEWIRKAYTESAEHGATVVVLVPSRTDTKWFHEYVLGKAEIRFIKGRLKFGGSKNSAPFPSMIVIYRAEIVCKS